MPNSNNDQFSNVYDMAADTFGEGNSPAPLRFMKGLGNIGYTMVHANKNKNIGKLDRLKLAFKAGFNEDIGPQQMHRQLNQAKAQIIALQLQTQGVTPQGANQMVNGHFPTQPTDMIQINGFGKRQVLVAQHRQKASTDQSTD